MKLKLLAAVALALGLAVAPAANAFDLEDYATTYRATRDAYTKAAHELRLARAALDYYGAAIAPFGIQTRASETLAPDALVSGECSTGATTYGDLGGALESFIRYAAPYLSGESVAAVISNFGDANFGAPARAWIDGQMTASLASLPVATVDTGAVPACGANPDGTFGSDNYSSLDAMAARMNDVRAAYLRAADQLSKATAPFLAARSAYRAATSTYTASLESTRMDGFSVNYPPYSSTSTPVPY